MDYNGNGEYDGEDESDLDPSLPAEATDPATCGELNPVPAAVDAGGGGTAGAEIAEAEEDGRPGFAELVARTGTPAHLATPATELDADLFMAVTTGLGDVVLGPPGTTPADIDTSEGAPSPH